MTVPVSTTSFAVDDPLNDPMDVPLDVDEYPALPFEFPKPPGAAAGASSAPLGPALYTSG
jgi:hypothetical protein